MAVTRAVNINSSPLASFASTSSIPRVVRSGDDVNDRRERRVRNRLRWLDGQWHGDGHIPPFKSPPSATGPQSAHGRRRVAQKRSRRASQRGEVVVTAVFKERPSEPVNQTPGRRRQLNRLRKAENPANLTDSSSSSAGGKKRGTARFLRSVVSSSGVGNEAGVRSPVDRRAIAIIGEAERTAASSTESRRDCFAQSSSKEVNVPDSEVPRKSTLRRDGDGAGHHDGDTSSRAGHHAVQGVFASPRTMAGDSDAISELSTESFTSSASVDDENKTCSKCFRQPSDEPLSALLMAPSVVEDDDAVKFLQGGARRSEFKPASPRRKHAGSDAKVVDSARIPVAATKWEGRQAHGRLNPNNIAARRASFGKSSLPLSAAPPGFELDAPSNSIGAAPSSSCTRTDRVGVLGMLDTVSANEHILGVRSTERSPLASNNLFDEEERGERSHRLLEEEIVSLKENLRRAEIRQAAAEATASSVLQRAQAAELSREVKEIQIRNLEIRLARYTNSDDHHHHREASVRRWGRHRGGNASHFRSQEPLFEAEEAPPPCETSDRRHTPAAARTTGNNSAAFIETVAQEARSSPAPNGFAGGTGARGGWGERLREFDNCFRHKCVVLGARAARAGEGAVAAAVEAAAVGAAKKTPKEATVLRAAAVAGGGQVQADNDSQARTDRDIMFNEYWGSDYCISV